MPKCPVRRSPTAYTRIVPPQGFAYNDWNRTIDVDTIYNRLESVEKTWAVYYSDDNDVAKFDRVAAKAYTTQDEGAEFDADRAQGVLGAFLDFRTFFKHHVASDKLSAYNFIEPAFGDSPDTQNAIDSMHAPHDLRPGDILVADVYEALRANNDVWNRTLLVITFDEHGGFYDHVVSPAAANPDGINSEESNRAPAFAFDRLGLRVPSILISPRLPKGQVVSNQYQHTSVLVTLTNLFKLGAPLTKRDAAARSFDDLLTNTFRTDAPATLPRFEMPESGSFALDAGPAQPDELLQEKADGWRAILARTVGKELPAPATTQDAHEVMREAVKIYSRWHFAKARGASA